MPGSEAARFGELDRTAAEVLRERAESLAQEYEADHVGSVVEILTCTVGEESYGVHVEDVKEIVSDYRVTYVPGVPDRILGVINVRGEIVSLTDMRRVLGAESAEQPPGDGVIIVGDDVCATALVVDDIGDIVEVPADRIEPPLSVADEVHMRHVKSSFTMDGTTVSVLGLEAVLAPVGEL
jgi:purine-binding chemotaxis protein CheW